MFHLPVCPHCGTVYRYKDTRQAIKNKDNTCYHCQKRFRARLFPTIFVGAIIPLVLCIAINIFLLTRMTNLQLLPLFAVTLGFLLIVYIIIPFFTKFKKIEEESNEKSQRKQG